MNERERKIRELQEEIFPRIEAIQVPVKKNHLDGGGRTPFTDIWEEYIKRYTEIINENNV